MNSIVAGRRTTLARTVVVLASLLLLAGCTDGTGPQPPLPRELRVLMPGALSGEPGHPLPEPVRVQLLGPDGRGVPGHTIDFNVIAGGGSVSAPAAVTDSAGIAETVWTLGPEPGTNRLRAEARAASVAGHEVMAQGSWGLARAVAIDWTAPGGVLPGGCALGNIVLRALDAAGNPVADAILDLDATVGGGQTQPASVRTDASGSARVTWVLGTVGGVNRLAARTRAPGGQADSVSAQAAPAAPGGYSVIGNQIVSAASCAPYRILGISRPSLEWWPFGDGQFVNVGQDIARIHGWGANTLRLPLSQSYWLEGTALHESSYRERVRATVTAARARGMNVILDLHVSDRGDAAFDTVPDAQQMPDRRHSIPFWREVATMFRDDGGVFFELYNEPHEVSWDMWLNGGTVAAGPQYPGGPWAEAFEAVGMQELYDVVRSTGARNLVIIGGTHWGYALDGVPAHRVQGYNIVYSTHPYDWPDKQPEVWDANFGFLAATDPVIIGEFGGYDCARLWYYRAVLDYADTHDMHWVAWAWWAPPPVGPDYSAAQRQEEICRFPSLISDWDGTPSASGALIRERLQQATAASQHTQNGERP